MSAATWGPSRPRTASRGNVAAREPRELVCLDTFYIGQLQGLFKVWQIAACDTACSYGVAWLLLPTPPGPASGLSSRDYMTFGL